MRRFLSVFALSLLFPLTAQAGACTYQEVSKLVDEACTLVGKDKEKAFPEIAKPKFNGACDSYILIAENVNETSMPLRFHPTSTALVGKNVYAIKDTKGTVFGKLFNLAAGKDGSAGWAEYLWPKNKGETPVEKCNYIKNCGGKYIAAMGVYSSCKALGVPNYFTSKDIK